MKTTFTLFSCLFCLFLLFSCSSTKDAYTEEAPEEQAEENTSYYDSLADFLKREGGVTVMGTGDNTRVLIRGMNSFKLAQEPLYVIDNMPIGNNYSQANNAVNANNIASVNVLKGANAMTLYGERSRNGVIVIKTKQSERLKKKG